MPANLSPEFKAAEDEYRQARDPQAKLACLEKMLSTIPKHKGTEKMQADIKRRISRLKEGLSKKAGKKGFAVKVEKEGAAQLVLVGAPNAGKSALVEITTNARTEAADHPFSTRLPVPGMLVFEDLQFQLVDLPPVSEEYMEPWVTDIIRTADAALWVVDAGDPELEEKVEEVTGLLTRKKLMLCGPDTPLSEGHDPVRRVHTLLVATKTDIEGAKAGLTWLKERFTPEFAILPLSALVDTDFTALKRAVFDLTRIMRVYSKTPGKEADLSKPHILHRGDCLIDFAKVVHKDFAEKLRFARVWGAGKFDGQRIQRDQELSDGDVVELHM
jgi:ribosome-interacting GTPase 1